MIILNSNPSDRQIKEIRTLYLEAFPKEERKPFELILEKVRLGQGELLAIEDDRGEFLGLAITLAHKDILLLDYFAIREDLRGRGVGGRAIEMLLEKYSDRRFILETEDPDEKGAANREERVRRLGFYLSHGLVEMDFRVWLFGVEMKILSGGRVVKFEEYHEIFTALFSEKTASNVRLL